LQDFSLPVFGAGTNYFPLYDRWADAYNVIIEFVHLQMARSLAAAGALASISPLTNQVWKRASSIIVFPNGLPAFSKACTAQLSSTQDLSNAQVVWDPGQASWNFLGQDPVFGTNYIFIPGSTGDGRTLQAEAVLPDGRRIFASTNFSVWDPVKGGTNFVNDANTIALYHFDATNNAFGDSTTNHFDLVRFATVALANNPYWMRNPTGLVARFRGAADYLEITNISDSFILPGAAATPLTIDARIYPRAWKTDGQFLVSLKQDPDTQWVLYYANNLTPDAPQLYANCCPMLSNAQMTGLLTLNTWHQLRVTFNTNGVSTAYIDGVLRTNVTFAPNYGRTSNWTLTLGHFDGDIDEVHISNTVRQ
jgi:hypothetical protein